jgi:hypothetical protein
LQDPVALAEKYGDLGLKFDRPMSEEEAGLLADGKRAEIIRNALIEAGPKGVLPGVAKFGAGLLGVATDPLEIATMFIPVVGQAGKAAAVARFGRVGGRVAVGAIEGGVGQALTEPLYYGMSKSAQLDYDMADSLMNIGLGFVFGGGIGSVAGALSRAEAGKTAPMAGVDPPRVEQKPLQLTDMMRVVDVRRLVAEQRPVADLALRQFVNGHAVDVAQVMPRFKAEDALAELYQAQAETAKFPLMNALKAIKIHPEGSVGQALKAAGVTPKTAPGLFSRKGHRDLDNLVASEWNEAVPDLSQIVGEVNGYLEPDGLVRAIVDEVAGRGQAGGKAQRTGDIIAAEREIDTLRDVFAQAERVGFRLQDEAEVAFVAEAMTRMGLDDALDLLARKTMDKDVDPASAVARATQPGPLEDMRASSEADIRVPDDFLAHDLEYWGAMVRQMEDNPELVAEMTAIRDIEDRAALFAEVAEAAATCLARFA